MGGHLSFLSQQELVCVLPLRLSGVIRADMQRKGHLENCIQLYLELLCYTNELPSLNTLLSLLGCSCSHPLLCRLLSVYASLPFLYIIPV